MKTYIIAEIGINHNQDKNICLDLIRAAADAGCDAAKIQFFRAKYLYSPKSGKLSWKDDKKRYSYDIFLAAKRTETPAVWLDDIVSCCRDNKVEFLASVFDEEGLDLLIKKGLKKIKIASSMITNMPFIRYCARTGLPVLLSTGGSDLGEVSKAVYAITAFHSKITLLQCTLGYPASPDECNLGVLKTYSEAFPFAKTGFSDHTSLIYEASVQAVHLGASVIEKHITLDKKMSGPDHFFALEPKELKLMVAKIRGAEIKQRKSAPIDKRLLGKSCKEVLKSEAYLRDFIFPVIFSRRSIKKSELISPGDLLVLRKANFKEGLPADYSGLFAVARIRARRNISAFTPLKYEDIA